MSAKRKSIDLKTKLQIIAEVKKGRRYNEIKKDFNVSKSTISEIYKDREKYEESDAGSDVKKFRASKFPEVEMACHEWLKMVRAQNLPVSGPVLMEKAKQFAEELGITGFAASDGWLSNFKSRHSLVFKAVVGESGSVTEEQIGDWTQTQLPALMAEFKEEDIFNLDETGLFWRLLPDKTLTFKNDPCSGGKRSKERITLLLGANMAGNEKLPVLAIGKSANPRCFKNVKSLPVKYAANKKAWMVSAEWESYLKFMDRKFRSQKRKVLFVVDNCPAHPEVKGLTNVRVVYLPPNTTSKTQPMDQGVIQNFKVAYRRFLLQQYLRCIDDDLEFQFNLLDCLYNVRRAWEAVTEATIKNCFKKAGFKRDDRPEEHAQDEESQNSDVWGQLMESGMTCATTFEDYAGADADIVTSTMPAESDIVALVKSRFNQGGNVAEEASSNDEEEEPEQQLLVPTSKEASKALSVLRNFVMSFEDGDAALKNITGLDGFISEKYFRSLRQSALTDFFH
jgi:transposase